MTIKKLVALLSVFFFIVPVGYNYLSGNNNAGVNSFSEQLDLGAYLLFFYQTLPVKFTMESMACRFTSTVWNRV